MLAIDYITMINNFAVYCAKAIDENEDIIITRDSEKCCSIKYGKV